MNATTITRASKSNLALAFVALSRERRDAITVFYAFCRVIDDIADSPEIGIAEKARQLGDWRQWLVKPGPGEPPLAREMRTLIERYSLSLETLGEIIAGVEMDLAPVRYQTMADLRRYCYRVASAVGLISIEIFGYNDPACREYAIELGMALQLTNIVRDVGKDLTNGGRIYLPAEDLAKFGYSEDELVRRTYNEPFVQLMNFEAARAWESYARARQLLPATDRRSMVAAEIMASVYRALLAKMQRDRFRVFHKLYSLSKPAKVGRILTGLIKARLKTEG